MYRYSKWQIREIAPTGGFIVNCTSTPTNTVSMMPVLENIFHYISTHASNYGSSMLSTGLGHFQAQYFNVSFISRRGKEQPAQGPVTLRNSWCAQMSQAPGDTVPRTCH